MTKNLGKCCAAESKGFKCVIKKTLYIQYFIAQSSAQTLYVHPLHGILCKETLENIVFLRARILDLYILNDVLNCDKQLRVLVGPQRAIIYK